MKLPWVARSTYDELFELLREEQWRNDALFDRVLRVSDPTPRRSTPPMLTTASPADPRAFPAPVHAAIGVRGTSREAVEILVSAADTALAAGADPQELAEEIMRGSTAFDALV